MKSTLLNWWVGIRESYWFVPSLLAFSAVVLSFVMTAIDQAVGEEWLESMGWVHTNKPDGARAVLATVAGSMITVAGVTFSMTILSISYTTAQVGPRLLNNFMRNLGNQITLGVFIATFLYCLLVLRTVRNGEAGSPDPTAGPQLAEAFVPHFATFTGVLLAIISVGVLIYFIHHVPESIHVSNILAEVGHNLNARIDRQFPSYIGLPHEDRAQRQRTANLPDAYYAAAHLVGSNRIGYVQYVDGEQLFRVACEHDLVIHARCRAGDFVCQGNVLLLAAPESAITDAVEQKLRDSFVMGTQRTDTQDLRFLIDQLVEVAMRALSPGVNDPFTAMYCMDWLQSALGNLAGRDLPDAHRYDEMGHLRIVAEADTFASLASLAFDQLRPYAATDRNAAIHLMEVMMRIAADERAEPHRRTLLRHAASLRRDCRRAITNHRDLKSIDEHFRAMICLSRDEAYRRRLLETGDWIGDRS